MAKEYTGSCLCGKLRYKATGKPKFPHLCSCTMCQQWSGALTVQWLEFEMDYFEWTSEKPTYYRSSKKSQRGFCSVCGSSIAAIDDGYDNISITMGSLDSEDKVRPGKTHSFSDALPAWWSVAIEKS